MGNRDFAGKEKKKPKKDVKKKQIISSIDEPRPEVEVIRKGKKPKDFEEEDQTFKLAGKRYVCPLI